MRGFHIEHRLSGTITYDINILEGEGVNKTVTFGDIQLWPLAYAWLLSKPYYHEVTCRVQNKPLKCCQSLELLMYIKRGLRSFYTVIMRSLDQRAAKLPSIKL